MGWLLHGMRQAKHGCEGLSPFVRLHPFSYMGKQRISSRHILAGKGDHFPGLHQQRAADGRDVLHARAPADLVSLGGHHGEGDARLAEVLRHGYVVARGLMADIHQKQHMPQQRAVLKIAVHHLLQLINHPIQEENE